MVICNWDDNRSKPSPVNVLVPFGKTIIFVICVGLYMILKYSRENGVRFVLINEDGLFVHNIDIEEHVGLYLPQRQGTIKSI